METGDSITLPIKVSTLLSNVTTDTDTPEDNIVLKTQQNAEGPRGLYLLRSNGEFDLLPRTLTRVQRSKPVSNSSAEIDVFNYTIPGYSLIDARTLRLRLTGSWLNNSGAGQTLRLRVYYGSGVLYNDVTASQNASTEEHGFDMDVVLQKEPGGDVIIGGRTMIAGVGAANNGSGDLGSDEIVSATVITSMENEGVAIDTTVDQPLRVTVQLSTATATSFFRVDIGVLELL